MTRRQSKSTESARAGSPGKGAAMGGKRSAAGLSRWMVVLAAGLIVLAAAAAYSNSFQGALVFDDLMDIYGNASLHRLWPIWKVFLVPSDGGMAPHGRPVVILSLALNYAMGGLKTFPYHFTNLLIHVLAGLTLFGIVRRTYLLPGLAERFGAAATPLALATSLLWILHPLDTSAVTYIIQRYESMMGLFYLLALYAAIRCGTSANPSGWAAVTAAAALLGMGCKEVAVSIPITILLYDRAFMAGSFREALRRRWRMYAGLAADWVLFAVFQGCSVRRGAWAGYELPVTVIEYARSQFGVILHYLRLTFWPCPLVLDYGWPVARGVGEILPGAVVIGGLAAATGYALVRWPKWGFLGAWFFLILAPTSSIMPLADLAVEYRMYLPLAAVAGGVVVATYLAGGWLVRRRIISPPRSRVMGGALVMLASLALGITTYQRNADYRSNLAIWEDTVAKAPKNDRAHNHYGNALSDCRRIDESIVEYRRALELNPDFAEAHVNLGASLADQKRLDEAISEFRTAVKLKPHMTPGHYNLAVVLSEKGQLVEAIGEYRKVLELKPADADAHSELGRALADNGQIDEAIEQYEQALKIDSTNVDAVNGLARLRAAHPESASRHEASTSLRKDR